MSALKRSHRYPVLQILLQPLWVTACPPKKFLQWRSLEQTGCFILCLIYSDISWPQDSICVPRRCSIRSALWLCCFWGGRGQYHIRGRGRPWTLLEAGMNCVIPWKMWGKGNKSNRLWQWCQAGWGGELTTLMINDGKAPSDWNVLSMSAKCWH